MRNFNKGFTLIELSIVLLIISLIIGGVLSGTSLIAQAKTRNIINTYYKYQTAINNFKLKYNYLPGDFPLASQVWPNCDPTPSNCNGDGDAKISVSQRNNSSEAFRAWQHLSLAEMISGNYTGLPNASDKDTIGVNIPSSSQNNSGYYFVNKNQYIDNVNRNLLIIGSSMVSAYNANIKPAFKPSEAYNIDLKIDDGISLTGRVRGMHYYYGAPICRKTDAGANASTTIYNINSDNTECDLEFTLN